MSPTLPLLSVCVLPSSFIPFIGHQFHCFLIYSSWISFWKNKQGILCFLTSPLFLHKGSIYYIYCVILCFFHLIYPANYQTEISCSLVHSPSISLCECTICYSTMSYLDNFYSSWLQMIVPWITLCVCVGGNMIRINCSHGIAGSRVSYLVLLDTVKSPPPNRACTLFSSHQPYRRGPISLQPHHRLYCLAFDFFASLMAEVYQYCFNMIPFFFSCGNYFFF